MSGGGRYICELTCILPLPPPSSTSCPARRLRGAADAATEDATGTHALGWVFSTALYLSIDAGSSSSVALRGHATSLATHTLLRLCSISTSRGGETASAAAAALHAPLIAALHQLCGILDMPTEPQTQQQLSAPPLSQQPKQSADDSGLAFHRAVPLYTFAAAVCPLPVTEDIAAHNALVSSPRALALPIVWLSGDAANPASSVSAAASSLSSSSSSSPRAGSPESSQMHQQYAGALSFGAAASTSGSGGSSASEVSPAPPPRVVPRLRAVLSSAPLTALTLLAQAAEALFSPPPPPGIAEGVPRKWLWQDPSWLQLWRDRVALTLIWLADGVGPPTVPGQDAAAAAAALQRGRTTGGAVSGSSGAAATNDGVVGLRVPRLPLFTVVLRIALRLFSCSGMRRALAAPLELFVNRVCLSAVSAPARLVQACAVLMSPLAVRTVLGALSEAQLVRDRLLRDYAHTSAVFVDVDAIGGCPTVSPATICRDIAAAAAAAPAAAGAAVGVVDVDTVRTLVDVLHPRSPLMLAAQAAVEALEGLVASTDFVSESVAWFDARLSASDVLRGVVQTCAAAATGQAYVFAVHGQLPVAQAAGGGGEASDKLLALPYPQLLRDRASRCLFRLLHALRLQTVEAVAAAREPGSSVAAQVAALRDCFTRKRILHACARTFNAKPKRGVEALRATGLLDPSLGTTPAAPQTPGVPHVSLASQRALLHAAAAAPPGSTSSASPHHTTAATAAAAVLRSFRGGGGFHPVAIGEFLGSGEDAEDDAKRRAHVAAHVDDFGGSGLVTALRIYLRTFRLPGEAQQVPTRSGKLLLQHATKLTGPPNPRRSTASSTLSRPLPTSPAPKGCFYLRSTRRTSSAFPLSCSTPICTAPTSSPSGA